LQRLCRQPLAVPLRHAHIAERDFGSIDRHLDAVCGLERGDLRGAGRGRPARRGRRRRTLSRIDARRFARARRALVLRRILRDLAPPRVNDMASVMTTVEDHADPIEAIADFMASFSLEATRPSADEVAALAGIVPAPASVYVSAVPRRPVHEAIDAAARLRKAGFEPVPHLAVRGFATARELDDFLARLRGEAGVTRALVVAGGSGEPARDLRRPVQAIHGGA